MESEEIEFLGARNGETADGSRRLFFGVELAVVVFV